MEFQQQLFAEVQILKAGQLQLHDLMKCKLQDATPMDIHRHIACQAPIQGQITIITLKVLAGDRHKQHPAPQHRVMFLL